MTDRELMQQALEALEDADTYVHAADLEPAITALRDRLAQPNEFNPDWDAMAVMLEEQQRMAKRIEELEAQPEQWSPKDTAYRPGGLAQPEQEPVAYYHPRSGFYWAKPTSIFAPTSVDVERLPLYTNPAQRPWQGLTPEDLAQIESDAFWQVGNHMAIAMAVEDRLRGRNK